MSASINGTEQEAPPLKVGLSSRINVHSLAPCEDVPVNAMSLIEGTEFLVGLVVGLPMFEGVAQLVFMPWYYGSGLYACDDTAHIVSPDVGQQDVNRAPIANCVDP